MKNTMKIAILTFGCALSLMAFGMTVDQEYKALLLRKYSLEKLKDLVDKSFEFGRPEYIEALLEKGFGVNDVFNHYTGATLLMESVLGSEKNNTALIGYLIDHNANVNATDRDGQTALHNAAFKGDTAAAQYLIDHGAKVNATDKRNRTPLWMAVIGFSSDEAKDMTKLLIKNNAQLNVQDFETGNTPLMQAAYMRRDTLVEILLAAGAATTLKNNDGKTFSDIQQEATKPRKLLLVGNILRGEK